MRAILKGTTAECLKHLATSVAENPFPVRDAMAAFVGVGGNTVYRWFRGVMMPVGEQLIKVQFFLEFIGYDVVELRGLDPVICEVARLCAFGVVSFDDVNAHLGYTTRGKSLANLLAVFRGVRGVSEERLKELSGIASTYRDQLSKRQRAMPVISIGQPTKAGRVECQSPPVSSTPANDHDVIVEALAGQIKVMLPLAHAVNSDTFTSEERARLRQLAGGDGVFRLANTLYRLCGERSRKSHQQ